MEINNMSSQRNSSNDEEESLIFFAGRVLLVFYCIIFIFGVLGNSMVIYVAIRKKNYHNVINCYVINLAIADLAFLTLSIPYTTYLGLKNTYPFGVVVCKIYNYLAYGFLQATCNIIAVMSIDRYLYIVQPKSKMVWRTPRNAFIICIIVWIGSLILIVPYHIISHVLTSGSPVCSTNEHKNLIICFFPFCSYYAIPLIIIIVCYTNLAMHVMKSGRQMTDHIDTKSFHQTVQLKQRRVTRMVMAVTLAFAICWLPIHILELLRCANSALLDTLIQKYPKALYSLRAFTHALAYFNSCLNPYLYALLNRNFCIDLVDIIPMWGFFCKRPNTLEHENSFVQPKALTTTMSQNPNYLSEKFFEDDYKNSVDNDSCQVGLLGIERKDISSSSHHLS